MIRQALSYFSVLICCAVGACSSDGDGSGSGGSKSSGGNAGTGGTSATGGGAGASGSAGTGTGGSSTGGAAGAGAGGASGSAGSGGSSTGGVAGTAGSAGAGGAPVVGNPALFTESVFEMDFSQGQNGRYRANGGAWEDFDPWNMPGQDGGWQNTAVRVQTTDAVRTELVPDALGTGRVLHTWIEAGDEWKSSAQYPRTELTSSFTADVAFNSEWRLEFPFYASDDVSSDGTSIIGFQFHHNSGSGSPPFAFSLSSGMLRFYQEETPSGPNEYTPIFPLQANTRVDLVFEVKFGYPADGAYIRLWANGTQYVDITDKKIGYPDLESTAGYWKYCSLYDWGNLVNDKRSVYSGPVVKLLKKP